MRKLLIAVHLTVFFQGLSWVEDDEFFEDGSQPAIKLDDLPSDDVSDHFHLKRNIVKFWLFLTLIGLSCDMKLISSKYLITVRCKSIKKNPEFLSVSVTIFLALSLVCS